MNGDFLDFGLKQSQLHKETFMRNKLDSETQTQLDEVATESLQAQNALEAKDAMTLEEYIACYFSNAGA